MPVSTTWRGNQKTNEFARIMLLRCPKCNFAMVIDVPKEVNKVFTCQNQACCYEFCRICECEWDDDHFGVSCEELDKTTKKNKEQRDL